MLDDVGRIVEQIVGRIVEQIVLDRNLNLSIGWTNQTLFDYLFSAVTTNRKDRKMAGMLIYSTWSI